MKDPAVTIYTNSRSEDFSPHSLSRLRNGLREFLSYLKMELTETAISELIKQTRNQHKEEDFSTDYALQAFGKTTSTHATQASATSTRSNDNLGPMLSNLNRPGIKAPFVKRSSF